MASTKGIDLVRHMQYFLAVAECRSFGRAAQLLGISQPPLSQGVQRLETRLGVRLFERRGGVRLTPDGDALMGRARTLVDAARAIVDDGAAHRAAFRLGIVGQLPAGAAARLVRVLADVTDGVPPGVLVGSSVALVSDVAAGRLDAALVIHPVVLDGVHAGSSVLRLPTSVLLPDTDRRAAAGSLALSELAGARLATAARADNPAAYDLVRDTVTVAGLVLDEMPVSDDRAALMAVAGGRCLALTADPTLLVPGCVQVPLRADPLPLRLRLVWPHAGTMIVAEPSVQEVLANALGASA